MLTVNDDLVLPERELSYRTSRSSGPGGQNVNKVETKVTVLFDVATSSVLSDSQKERVRERLATRTSQAGVLRVVSQRHRTQAANKEAARDKLAELLALALERKKKRTRTRVPAKTRRKRLEGKRRRSELKRQRGRVIES